MYWVHVIFHFQFRYFASVCYACILYLQHGNSAAHYAAKNGHLDIIRYLKHEGVNVNAQNDDVRLFPNHCLFSIKM